MPCWSGSSTGRPRRTPESSSVRHPCRTGRKCNNSPGRGRGNCEPVSTKQPPGTNDANNANGEDNMIYDTILDTIGNTPIVRLHRTGPEHVTLYVKVESC